jgi:Holliday junction resolvase RusA-like endonuclease
MAVGFDLFLDGKVPTRHQPDYRVITPKHGRPFAQPYPHEATKEGMARWRTAWLQHDQRPYLTGHIAVQLDVVVQRPAGHLLVDGTLSAEGRRRPYPGTPDVDNVCKMALDALKGLAFDDDVMVVYLRCTKRYGIRGDRIGGLLRVTSVATMAPPAERLALDTDTR